MFCSNCGEQNPEQARFCFSCGSPLVVAPPAPPPVVDEERKLDTLVFVDLVGSTALAEQLDPEDVLALLELYYSRLRSVLEARGGTVEKYIGDAIVTHFGVPVGHEDDPERAVRAALSILETVAALNAEDPIRELQVRIGIATGEVIVTHGAKAEEGKGIAWGDVLNTAARIESAAPVNGILVGEETYRATAHTIEYVDHDPLDAKGKSEPVRVWQAVGLKQALTRGRERDAPLIGRAEEVARLLALWDQVLAQGRPAIATLLADPGMGKSRLLTEVAHVASGDPLLLWGRCLSYGEGITYWPVQEILEDAAGVLKTDDRETEAAKVAGLLDGLGSDDPDQLRTIAAALSNLFGTVEAQPASSPAAEISQAELHWGIRRVFELLAAKRPLMLVFEDLHWAEPTLLDLIDYIADASGPIFILGSARKELRELRQEFCIDSPTRTTISLSALGEADSEALLTELLGARGLPAGSRTAQLLRNAGGNPLFLEETVRMLDDAGVLDGEGDLDDVAVPTTLQAMIGSRLDSLPAADKRVAHHASVVGMVFWSGAVAELHGGGAEVDPSLESLEEREFVRASDESSLADEREWAFRHGLIRDVAYSRVPKGRRAHLHVGFADWVDSIPGAADELVEVVAYHLEQACRHAGVGRSEAPPPIERAVEALMGAAEKAERREGIREADRFYARALEIVGDEHAEAALELRLRRAGTLNALGELQKADELLADVVSSAAGLGRPDLRGRALLSRANIAGKQGRAAHSRAHLAEAAAIAEELQDSPLRIRCTYEGADLDSWFDGDLDTAVGEVREALALAEALDDRALRIEGHVWLVSLLYNLGNLVDAEEELMRCSDLLGEDGSLRQKARVGFQLALVKYHLGEIEEAERLGEQANAWLERTGETYIHLQNRRTLALCALARSDLELAEHRLREAIPPALEIGGWIVVEIYRWLANVLVRRGRLEDARLLGELALHGLPEEDAYARAGGLLIEAGLATAEGRRKEASEMFVEALGLLEQQRLPLDLAEARLAYAQALRSLGSEADAYDALIQAREELERMGARGLVAEVDRELGELGEGAGRRPAPSRVPEP